MKDNIGKNRALNLAFESGQFKEGLLCFTDSDGIFEQGALISAAKFFLDPSVGLVGGKITYLLDSAISANQAEGAFWQIENTTREAEGNLGCLVSCTGQFIMMRHSLFQPIPADINTDFAMPLMVLAQGYATRFDHEALVKSPFPSDQETVLRRRQRTIIRALATIKNYKKQLPWRIRFVLFWHKTARFYAYPMQLIIILSSFALMTASPFWFFIFLSQIIFYGLVIIGWLYEHFNIKTSMVHLPYQFTLQNAVAFRAVLAYHRGQRIEKWTPPR